MVNFSLSTFLPVGSLWFAVWFPNFLCSSLLYWICTDFNSVLLSCQLPRHLQRSCISTWVRDAFSGRPKEQYFNLSVRQVDCDCSAPSHRFVFILSAWTYHGENCVCFNFLCPLWRLTALHVSTANSRGYNKSFSWASQERKQSLKSLPKSKVQSPKSRVQSPKIELQTLKSRV